MKEFILAWFASPEIIGDEENIHRVRLMNGLINTGIVFTLLVFCANMFDRSTHLRNYLIDLLVLVVFLSTRRALHKGKILFAGIGSLTIGFILTIVSIVSDGTVRSSAVSILLLVIIISGILYRINGIVISTTASSLAVLALLFAEKAGMLPRPDYSPSFVYWFILTFTFAIVGSITYYSNQVTMQAFKRANDELRERQGAERNLKAANEELQKRVMEVEKLQEELREQALHDPLTGLYNRRYLDETLSREILRARRINDCLSIIIADVDHFKMINDAFGHKVGDLFLIEIAQLFKRLVRGSDTVCRYGGEEFVLILPGASLQSAEKRADELRQACAQLTVQYEEKDLNITMSFGMATYPIHGEGGDDIVMKADHALFDAKRMGRNQVKVWCNPPIPS